MNKLQKGFTLIELVIVVTIIAILAAIALPKYIAMQTDARVAKMQAIYGSIRTAAALAKARCELDLAQGLTTAGTCGNVTPRVNMDGTLVNMINRYPTDTAAGIDAAANIDATNDGMTVTGTAPRTFTANGAITSPANCRISYTAAAAGFAPVITLDVTNCS
jgi:MSHA pilin protein MshA